MISIKILSITLLAILLFTVFSMRKIDLVHAIDKVEPDIVYQIDDEDNARIGPDLMHVTSYGTHTDRLVLPGYRASVNGGQVPIYRVRYQNHVFVFYRTNNPLFGETYLVFLFDMKGQLVKQGHFQCREVEVPVTLVRITREDHKGSPIFGLGLYDGTFITPELFGQGGGEKRWRHRNLMNQSYLTFDQAPSQQYLKEHKLDDQIMVSVKPIIFNQDDGEHGDPIQLRNQKTEIYVRSLDMKIPFLRFKSDDSGPLPPIRPEHPKTE